MFIQPLRFANVQKNKHKLNDIQNQFEKAFGKDFECSIELLCLNNYHQIKVNITNQKELRYVLWINLGHIDICEYNFIFDDVLSFSNNNNNNLVKGHSYSFSSIFSWKIGRNRWFKIKADYHIDETPYSTNFEVFKFGKKVFSLWGKIYNIAAVEKVAMLAKHNVEPYLEWAWFYREIDGKNYIWCIVFEEWKFEVIEKEVSKASNIIFQQDCCFVEENFKKEIICKFWIFDIPKNFFNFYSVNGFLKWKNNLNISEIYHIQKDWLVHFPKTFWSNEDVEEDIEFLIKLQFDMQKRMFLYPSFFSSILKNNFSIFLNLNISKESHPTLHAYFDQSTTNDCFTNIKNIETQKSLFFELNKNWFQITDWIFLYKTSNVFENTWNNTREFSLKILLQDNWLLRLSLFDLNKKTGETKDNLLIKDVNPTILTSLYMQLSTFIKTHKNKTICVHLKTDKNTVHYFKYDYDNHVVSFINTIKEADKIWTNLINQHSCFFSKGDNLFILPLKKTSMKPKNILTQNKTKLSFPIIYHSPINNYKSQHNNFILFFSAKPIDRKDMYLFGDHDVIYSRIHKSLLLYCENNTRNVKLIDKKYKTWNKKDGFYPYCLTCLNLINIVWQEVLNTLHLVYAKDTDRNLCNLMLKKIFQ